MKSTSPWHTWTVEAVLSDLQATPAGLTGVEAARRLAEQGPNELAAAHRASPLPWVDWAIVVGLAFTVSPLLEVAKWLARRGWLGPMG